MEKKLTELAEKELEPLDHHYNNLDPEKVLHQLGKYGRYQMVIYWMSNMGYMIFAMETMIMSVIGIEPEFSCDSTNLMYEVVDKCTVRKLGSQITEKCGIANGTFHRFRDEGNSSLIAEFDLVCDKAGWVQHGTSVFMIAGLIMTPLVTFMADRYGRRMTFLVPMWTTVIVNIACSMSPNYYIFLLLRFAAGMGTAGICTVGYVIQIEAVTESFRSMTPLFGTIVWVIGYMMCGVLRLLITNWRWLYFSISVPGLMTFAFYWLMPESLHWSVVNKKPKQINKYVLLGKIYSQTIANTTNAWTSVNLHENEMIGYFLSGFVELPAGILAMGLLHLFGRRNVTIFSVFLQAVCMCAAALSPMSRQVNIIFPLLAKMFNSVAWTSEPLLLSELSPTSVRNVVFGSIGVIGELGAVFAPYLNSLKAIHERAPQLFIGVLSAIASILIFSTPETKGKPLPRDLDDFDEGAVFSKLRKMCCCSTSSKKESTIRCDPEADGQDTALCLIWNTTAAGTLDTYFGFAAAKFPCIYIMNLSSLRKLERNGGRKMTMPKSVEDFANSRVRSLTGADLNIVLHNSVSPTRDVEILSEVRRAVNDGDYKSFLLCVSRIAQLLVAENFANLNAALVHVMNHIVRLLYDEENQITVLMSLASMRDKKCSEIGHGYCRIISTILNTMSGDEASAMLHVCAKKTGMTAFHRAAESGEICQLLSLLEHATTADPSARDAHNRTVLFYAVARKDMRMLKILLWYGCDISSHETSKSASLVVLSHSYDNNEMADFISERTNALERIYLGEISALCKDIFAFKQALTNIHFIRAVSTRGHIEQSFGHHPFVSSFDIALNFEENYEADKPSSAMVFIVPFYYTAVDEESPASCPQIFRSDFSFRRYSSYRCADLIHNEPILKFSNTNSQIKLNPAIEPVHNGVFYCFSMPDRIPKGDHILSFFMDFHGFPLDQLRTTLLAIQVYDVVPTFDIKKNV